MARLCHDMMSAFHYGYRYAFLLALYDIRRVAAASRRVANMLPLTRHISLPRDMLALSAIRMYVAAMPLICRYVDYYGER